MGESTKLERALLAAFDSASAASAQELHELGSEACSALRAMQRAIASFVIAVDKKRNPRLYAAIPRRGSEIAGHRKPSGLTLGH